MSVEHYDLGVRLRAASTRRPVPRAAFATAATPRQPIAVAATGTGTDVTLHASDGSRSSTATGHNALAALAALDVAPHGEHRTLVVSDNATLGALTRLARATRHGDALDHQAAVVAWWQQRAEHPGSSATIVLTAACRDRWVLGTAPDDERSIDVWARWHALSDTTPTNLLRLAQLVTDGLRLPGLEALDVTDELSWNYFGQRLSNGRDWRSPDNREEAALGLATRCHAAELFASARLTDPLIARREAYNGNLVTATVTDLPERGTITATSTRLACRLRRDAEVHAWAGGVEALPLTPTTTTVKGVLADVQITATGDLALTVTDALTRPGRLTVGDTLTLRAAPVDARQQHSGRRNLRQRYQATGNWLARGPAPTTRRRPVPLDVVIAAAED